jgi:hypothetical protein
MVKSSMFQKRSLSYLSLPSLVVNVFMIRIALSRQIEIKSDVPRQTSKAVFDPRRAATSYLRRYLETLGETQSAPFTTDSWFVFACKDQ